MEPSIRAAFSPINIIKTMNYFGERKKKKKERRSTLGTQGTINYIYSCINLEVNHQSSGRALRTLK